MEGGKQEASRVHRDHVLKSRTRPKVSARATIPTKRNADTATRFAYLGRDRVTRILDDLLVQGKDRPWSDFKFGQLTNALSTSLFVPRFNALHFSTQHRSPDVPLLEYADLPGARYPFRITDDISLPTCPDSIATPKLLSPFARSCLACSPKRVQSMTILRVPGAPKTYYRMFANFDSQGTRVQTCIEYAV